MSTFVDVGSPAGADDESTPVDVGSAANPTASEYARQRRVEYAKAAALVSREGGEGGGGFPLEPGSLEPGPPSATPATARGKDPQEDPKKGEGSLARARERETQVEVDLRTWAGLENLLEMAPGSSRGPVYLESGDRFEIRAGPELDAAGCPKVFAQFERFARLAPPVKAYGEWAAGFLQGITGGGWLVRELTDSQVTGGIFDRAILRWYPRMAPPTARQRAA